MATRRIRKIRNAFGFNVWLEYNDITDDALFLLVENNSNADAFVETGTGIQAINGLIAAGATVRLPLGPLNRKAPIRDGVLRPIGAIYARWPA